MSKRTKPWERDALVAHFRATSKDGVGPSVAEYEAASRDDSPSAASIMRAFGSWTKACEAAGVETARDGARRLRAERDLEAARAYDVRQRAERAAREARRESEAENRRVQPGHESVSARRGRERNEERAARVREQIQNGEVRVTWASDTQIEAWRREKEAGRRARYELSDAELGIVPGAISEPDDAVADVEDISDEEIDDLEDVAA